MIVGCPNLKQEWGNVDVNPIKDKWSRHCISGFLIKYNLAVFPTSLYSIRNVRVNLIARATLFMYRSLISIWIFGSWRWQDKSFQDDFCFVKIEKHITLVLVLTPWTSQMNTFLSAFIFNTYVIDGWERKADLGEVMIWALQLMRSTRLIIDCSTPILSIIVQNTPSLLWRYMYHPIRI